MRRVSDCLRWAVVCMALATVLPGLCWGWGLGRTEDSWPLDPRREDSYAYRIHNNTGTAADVLHDRLGVRYSFAPGQTAFLAAAGCKLKFHPSEIRCWTNVPCTRCIIRPAVVDTAAVLMLELVGTAPPSNIARMRHATLRAQPAAAIVQQPTRSPAQGTNLDVPGTLREFMERMVHVCYYSRGAEKDRKLGQLKQTYQERLQHVLPQNILSELGNYEAVCQCIHKQASSGLSMSEIFSRKRCGDFTTREMRARILSALRQSSR